MCIVLNFLANLNNFMWNYMNWQMCYDALENGLSVLSIY